MIQMENKKIQPPVLHKCIQFQFIIVSHTNTQTDNTTTGTNEMYKFHQ